tara:strand:+ start:1085 stop:1303 length:219 start_codon:yes stop_codon:yes gene_type:complete
MDTKELIQELQRCIKNYPLSANYLVRVVEGNEERTSNNDHEAEVNYWASHIEIRDSITEDQNNGEIIIYSSE